MRTPNDIHKMLSRDVQFTETCWNWRGAILRNGYGKVIILEKDHLAHRVFFEHFTGPIPAGFQIDHLCRNRRCVNPSHLEAVTPRVNTCRSDNPAGRNSRKTECIHGHALAGNNLYVTPDGRRQCRTCRNTSSQRVREGGVLCR